MDLAGKSMIVFVSMFAVFQVSLGAVYKVGDFAGWTIIGNLDYKEWSSSKSFQVGDSLVFEYDSRFHNVLEVRRSDYHACNGSSPIATYSTGNDSIAIKNSGHYYYICGFVGHCQAGQKVDIRVPKSMKPIKSPSPSPTTSPVQLPRDMAAPENGPAAQSPFQTNEASPCLGSLWLLVIVIGLYVN